MTACGRYLLWALWACGTAAMAAWLGSKLLGGGHPFFLPGATTAGHYQIELACSACHTAAFADREAVQAACDGCHGEALAAARDSHPQSKFTDPRNADRTALLDARYCVACHVEHRPALADAMGVTVPADVCGVCHAEIAAERPSHAGMGFETCGSAGCHNFHDNRALYEDFLVKNADAPPLLAEPRVLERNFAAIAEYLESYPTDAYPLRALQPADADAPYRVDAGVVQDWAATAHAASGVNCTACHGAGESGVWRDKPGYERCAGCHAEEQAGFVRGKHGMRLNATANRRMLAPLAVADARLPMKRAAGERTVDCGACHPAHRFDTAFAAVDACLDCHDDAHSRAFRDSPHFTPSAGSAGSAITCATCHMPRVQQSYDFGAFVHVLVQHDQSGNLRPNEKMLRDVCMDCHGLGFSLDALADPEAIGSNFSGAPRVHVQSVDLAAARAREIELRRQAERASEPR